MPGNIMSKLEENREAEEMGQPNDLQLQVPLFPFPMPTNVHSPEEK